MWNRIRNATLTVWRFYIEGFKSMTIGRSLWALIIIKLILIFVVMRLFFLPDVLDQKCDTEEQKAETVRSALIR